VTDLPVEASPYLTLDEAASRCRLSSRTLRRAIQAGELMAYQPRNRLLLEHNDLDAWIAGAPVRPRLPQPNRSAPRSRSRDKAFSLGALEEALDAAEVQA